MSRWQVYGWSPAHDYPVLIAEYPTLSGAVGFAAREWAYTLRHGYELSTAITVVEVTA